MCGIAGIFNFRTQEPVSPRLLKAMTDTLVHRGPDDEGFYISGPVGLGHRRLSIIDLEGGHQPLTNEDDTVWVVFNGEIYNFMDLHDELVNKGHTFKTRSDTEVIVHLYEEEGERCFERSARNVCDRHLGWAKPQTHPGARSSWQEAAVLLLRWFENRVCLGDEGILEVPGVPRDIDLEAVSDYFSFLYIPAPKSIFKNIRKVLPGHYVVVSDKGFVNVEYWDINFAETRRQRRRSGARSCSIPIVKQFGCA
jgi:asparagine synthase (glutamine-hydrolysing)